MSWAHRQGEPGLVDDVAIASRAALTFSALGVPRNDRIAWPADSSAAAIRSCSASNWVIRSSLMPALRSAGQAMRCSLEWCRVSCSWKLAQAAATCSTRRSSSSPSVLSALVNRSRSRRTAPWITRFMLISAISAA
jgi:hypothetical protein